MAARRHHQYAGTPAASSAAPAADLRGLVRITLKTTAAAAATKSPGSSG
jgi:hypothetical protein